MSDDKFNLERFVRRQKEDYDRAYKELLEESKRSHWMWWIFPQITGLGQSRMTESYFEGTARHGCRAPRSNMMTSTSQEYSIKSMAEAKAYLEHPVLGKNIREISKLLTTINQSNASIVFGYPDDLKLRSSMTLFAEAAESDEDRNIFLKVLDKFFDGKKDTRTLEILKQIGE